MTDVLELPFDQYQRYRLASDLLHTVAAGQRLRVLDVGGRTALLRSFLPEHEVQLVDLEPSAEPGLVLGSGAALPFRDHSFDAVCAFDTLEHVPPDLRDAFVRECARVARRWVFLVGPYEAPRVVEAELLLQRFLNEKLAARHRYLEEHRDHGLPDRARVERELAARGARVQSFGHANLERWLFGMCLALYLDHDPALRGMAKAFHRFYNAELYRSDHAEPVYRHAVVGALAGAPLPELAGLLEAPAAPRRALAPFERLFGELVAFDRERVVWRAEREHFERSVAELKQDLDGHQHSLAEVRAENEAQAQTLAAQRSELAAQRAAAEEVRATLELDLSQHKQALGELTLLHDLALQSVRSVEGELAREREQGAAARSTLESDLATHRASLATAQREVLERRAEQERLAGEIARVEIMAQKIQAELLGSNANAEALGRDLARLQQEIEGWRASDGELRALLNDRWLNLKRALALHKLRF